MRDKDPVAEYTETDQQEDKFSSPFFTQNLVLSLKLESDGKEEELPTGNIQRISFNLYSFGHACTLKFFTYGDEPIDQMLVAPKIIKATLAFKPTDPMDGTEPILEIKGIVTDRCFKRMPAYLGEEEKANRVYEIHVIDSARATWGEHYPTNIYVDESMKDVIDKHANPDIAMKYEWDPLEVKHPIIAFSLEHKYWLQPYQQTNFYSFLIWYLHQENGILIYDYTSDGYTITGKKKPASGSPLKVYEQSVRTPLCVLPRPERHNAKNIKHTSKTADAEDKEHANPHKGIRRELIDAQNYRIYPEQAKETVQSDLIPKKNEIDVEFIEFSGELQIDKLTPGSYLSFQGDGEGNWTRDPCFKDKTFRVRSLYFEANLLAVEEDLVKVTCPFQIYLKAKLEQDEETHVEWPAFIPPKYPFYIQGEIFCDIGDKPQSTYKILETKEAPLGQYQVLVPLAGKDKKVVAPFVPAFSGQFYYPLCKGAEVMLEMHFRTAKIDRPINWEPYVRMPNGVQGNQIVFGSNGKDKFTFLRHVYEDGKNEVLTIQQSSSDTIKKTFEFKFEGNEINTLIEEKDKTSTFTKFNLDSMTYSINDKENSTNLQSVYNRKEKSITHTVKGSEGTSNIVQKPDSIAIDCKNFSIKSETLVFDVKDSISQTGKNKVTFESKVLEAKAPSVKLG